MSMALGWEGRMGDGTDSAIELVVKEKSWGTVLSVLVGHHIKHRASGPLVSMRMREWAGQEGDRQKRHYRLKLHPFQD